MEDLNGSNTQNINSSKYTHENQLASMYGSSFQQSLISWKYQSVTNIHKHWTKSKQVSNNKTCITLYILYIYTFLSSLNEKNKNQKGEAHMSSLECLIGKKLSTSD